MNDSGLIPILMRELLKQYSIADLVAELDRRGGCPVKCSTVDETSTAPVCLSVIPTAPLVAELCSREGVESHSISESYQVSIVHEIECLDPVEVYGPAKIIVVRGE